MKKLFNIFIAIATISITSCDEVIDFDLHEGQQRVMVEGLIVNDQPAVVKLSRTTSFYSSSPTPKITDATVIITDNTGAVDTLTHEGDGVYKGDNIVGVFDRTYVLKVIDRGVEYTSQSKLPRINEIDSIVYEYRDRQGFFSDSGYYVTFYAKDPPGEKNYYLGKYYKNNGLITQNNFFYLYSDELIEENTSIPVEFETVYYKGDVAKMEFFSLTKEAYDFYLKMISNLNNDGGFYSTPPANVKGNISNGALGLFQASGMVTASLTIQ
ncbi:MAG TPA: DUF4249 domain-containing protein [Cytophagaceae bacterium]